MEDPGPGRLEFDNGCQCAHVTGEAGQRDSKRLLAELLLVRLNAFQQLASDDEVWRMLQSKGCTQLLVRVMPVSQSNAVKVA